MSKKNQFKQANVLTRKPISTSNEEVEYVEIIDSDIVVFNPFHPDNQDVYEEFVGVISKIATEGKDENGEVSFSGIQVLKLLFPVLTNANFDGYTDEELEFVVDNVDMYLDIVEAKDLVMDYCVRFLNHLERFSKLPDAAKKYYMQQGKNTADNVKKKEKVEVEEVKEAKTEEAEEEVEAQEMEEVILPNTQYTVENGTIEEVEAIEEVVEDKDVKEETAVGNGAVETKVENEIKTVSIEVPKNAQAELDDVEKQIFQLMQKRNDLKKQVRA